MPRVYCKDCVFWDITHDGNSMRSREGRCRRHAPTPQSDDITQDFGTVWPATFEDDWCGEGRAPDSTADGQIIDVESLAASLTDD